MHRATAFDPTITQYGILPRSPQHKRLSLVPILLLVPIKAPVMLRQIRNSHHFISSESFQAIQLPKEM